jgi:ABC-type sugar transport system substrate-binding protein
LSAPIITAADGRKQISLGLRPGRLIVVGGNSLAEGLDLIKQGKQYSTDVKVPARIAAGLAKMNDDYFAGNTLPKFNNQPIETITAQILAKWKGSAVIERLASNHIVS